MAQQSFFAPPHSPPGAYSEAHLKCASPLKCSADSQSEPSRLQNSDKPLPSCSDCEAHGETLHARWMDDSTSSTVPGSDAGLPGVFLCGVCKFSPVSSWVFSEYSGFFQQSKGKL
ncbi:unnamed protein product [Pleuronectes platessa]|uniref:Uncharacterized protein n=1 Tax=Pleuronectes platessa TaxID=8262 RepID=A0A9N7YHQ9_PLEPL|nr:unnamed protein product [Pleuronectes platessa]